MDCKSCGNKSSSSSTKTSSGAKLTSNGIVKNTTVGGVVFTPKKR